MALNLELVIDRKHTQSIKWDHARNYFNQSDILPMWVADMDFPAPPSVVASIQQRAAHPIYGYTLRSNSYYQAFIDWTTKRHHWSINKAWLCDTPGVVAAIALSIATFTDPGDKVLIQTPVYPAFFDLINSSHRRLVESPLIRESGYYVMDFADLEAKFAAGVRAMILCSPHNPVGRVWRKEELEKLAALCIEYNVLVISDEIWCDLVYPESSRHVPLASLSLSGLQTITCMAPSKTFNLAGLNNAITIIPDVELRERFQAALERNKLSIGNIFGISAFETAYCHGGPWLSQVIDYISANRLYAMEKLSSISGIKVTPAEGTYLLWLDFRPTGLSHQEINRLLIERGKIGLNDGQTFGTQGTGFFRINIATPIRTLTEGVQRIKHALA